MFGLTVGVAAVGLGAVGVVIDGAPGDPASPGPGAEAVGGAFPADVDVPWFREAPWGTSSVPTKARLLVAVLDAP